MLQPLALHTTVALLCGICAAAPAAAQTVNADISFSAGYPTGTGFNVHEQTLVLPSGFTNALLNIASVYANDAAVLQVNGVNIVGWGIFGPGAGSFAFSASGPFVPFTYTLGHGFSPLTVNQSYSAPFVVGANSIKLFHNDNGNGIAGGGFSVDNGEVRFNASVTYTAAVPEPGTWLLLLAGGGVLVRTMRHRRHSRT